MSFMITSNQYSLIITFALVIILLTATVMPSGIAQIATTKKTMIPAYEITTRGNLDKPIGVQGFSYQDRYPLNNTQELYDSCPDEIAIIVHGWGLNENQAKERFDRVKMSLVNSSYPIPIVGFSWDSDTVWIAAQFLAKWNGPKLADFIFNLMNTCKQQHDKDIKIRLIGHSLGSRIILSSLDSLHKNPIWNSSNFKIASVHLMGAAVDNEEVSKNPQDILDDKTNWGTVKSDYGETIQEEVVNFYNLFNPNDNIFEPNLNPALQVYPSFEGDLALGQSGYQVPPEKIISLPTNYDQIDIRNEILPICDADGDKKSDFLPIQNITIGAGDNHGGYFGFRNARDNTKLIDNGAISVVVDNWKKLTPNINELVKLIVICN